jgi:hypothetical protein
MVISAGFKRERWFPSVSIFEGSGNPALAHIRDVESLEHQELASLRTVAFSRHPMRRTQP